MIKYYFFTILVLINTIHSYSADLPVGFVEQVIAEKLNPVSMAVTPDGRVLIAEKHGIIKLIYNNTLQSDPFLEIDVDSYNERGLQNIILDPNFEINNYLYVFYTSLKGVNVISRFTATGNYALPGSELVLFESHPVIGTVHNGGSMLIGTDNKLYAGFGDAAQSHISQNMQSTNGKIIRINLDGSIPQDNPFYESVGDTNKAIYASGFRNPFSMDINKSTGEIYVNDVGGSKAEEVNKLIAGKNYGWPIVEGFITNETAPGNYQEPLVAYDHSQGKCAVVGAAFYQPEDLMTFPVQYWNQYFYGDYCSKQIFYIGLPI